MLTLLLLTGCFDSADTTVTIDVKKGETHVVQRMHNGWPDTVGCGTKEDVLPTTEECVAKVKEYLQGQVSTLEGNGATIAKAGIILAEGELDFLYDYTAPAGGKTMTDQGLSVYWARERSDKDVKADKQGKKQLAMLVIPQDSGKTTVDVQGKYKLLQGDIGDKQHSIYTFSGSSATVVANWRNEGGFTPSPGAWLKEREGLEAALAASGLVVVP